MIDPITPYWLYQIARLLDWQMRGQTEPLITIAPPYRLAYDQCDPRQALDDLLEMMKEGQQ